jgi:hypothetical protein
MNAKTFAHDDLIVVVLLGMGFTPLERTMMAPPEGFGVVGITNPQIALTHADGPAFGTRLSLVSRMGSMSKAQRTFQPNKRARSRYKGNTWAPGLGSDGVHLGRPC